MRGTPDQAAALMKPYAGAIEVWEVGAEVGNVKNNRHYSVGQFSMRSSHCAHKRISSLGEPLSTQ